MDRGLACNPTTSSRDPTRVFSWWNHLPRISKPYFVIFDLDGVVAEELAAEGVATTANALLAGHRGKIIDESVRRFERDYSIALSDDWIDRVIPRALVKIDRRLVPIPDAIMVLRACAGPSLTPERGVAVEDFRASISSGHGACLTAIGFAPNAGAESLLATGTTAVIKKIAVLPSVLSI
jgi:beta-phosphoglucomutase-like phosphatase (HAD superfamily)